MRTTPEQSVQLTCVEFTAIFCPSVLVSSSQNGLYLGDSKRVGSYITRQKKLGMLVGELDLMLTWEKKNILYIEVKAKDGRLSENQKSVISIRQQQGFDCCVAYSFQEYFQHLRAHNVPMRGGAFPSIGIFPPSGVPV